MAVLMTIKRHRKPLLFVLGLTLLILIIVLSDIGEVIEALRPLTWVQLALLVGLQLLTLILINVQWRAVAWHLKLSLSFRSLLKMNFLGTFFESVTPAVKTGGEAYKFFYLKQERLSSGDAAALITTQKGISFMTFLTMALIALLSSGLTRLLEASVLTVIAVNAGIILGVFVAFFLVVRRQQSRPADTPGKFAEFFNALAKLKDHKQRLVVHALLGGIIWALYALKTMVVLRMVGVELAFTVVAAITYITYIVNMLPLSPGGLGTFEGTMTGLLVAFSIAPGVALAVTITLRVFTFWFMLLLSALYLGIDHVIRRQGFII